MKLHQHLDIGKILLDKLGSTDIKKYNINKIAYLLGNIAPDLNCVYPAHRLSTTEKRFYRKIKIIDKTDINILRSFQLGTLTHYICDYFCYAHSIESLGGIHRIYEKNLYNFYKEHVDEIKKNSENIKDIWLNNKIKTFNNVIHNNIMNTEDHSKFVIEQLKLMSKQYMSEFKHYENNMWIFDFNQIQEDLKYSMFMVENIVSIILEPFKCSLAYT